MKRLGLVLLCMLIGAPLWAATSNVSVQEGGSPTKYMATNSITEDTATKQLQRVVPNTSAGVEIAPLTDTQLRATAVPISVATIPSHAVTNAGTFAVQAVCTNAGTFATQAAATLAAETTKVIGTVNVAAAQTIAVTNAGLTALNGAIAGTEVQVDVLTMPSTAVTNAGITSIDGKITACNTGAVVLAAGTAEIGKLAAGTAEIGKLGAGTAEIGKLAAGTAVIGSIIPNKFATTDDAAFMKKYYTSAGAATDGIVWSPAASTRWYVTDLIISTSAATTVTLEDDLTAGDSPVLKLDLAANGGCVVNFKTPLASGEDAADLMVTTSAGNIYITAVGYEI